MVLSGTTKDYIILKVLPISLFFGLGFYFLLKENIETSIIIAVLFNLIGIVVFSVRIYFKKLKSLKIVDGIIQIDEEEVSPKSIMTLTPYVYSGQRSLVSLETLQIWIKKNVANETLETHYILLKPTTIINKKSKTLTTLFAVFPELESKLKIEIDIDTSNT